MLFQSSVSPSKKQKLQLLARFSPTSSPHPDFLHTSHWQISFLCNNGLCTVLSAASSDLPAFKTLKWQMLPKW